MSKSFMHITACQSIECQKRIIVVSSEKNVITVHWMLSIHRNDKICLRKIAQSLHSIDEYNFLRMLYHCFIVIRDVRVCRL